MRKLIDLPTRPADRQGDMVGGAHWPPSVHGQERLVQRYAYEWDEVGRLVRARRWDMQNPTTIPPDDADVDAELSFTYDASDQRVRKTSGAQHTLYVFASLELRGAEYEAGDYSQTEVPYLFANGVRLARVVQGDSTSVYLELGDHLGSTSVVLDHATGELVQRDTAYAYGAAESSYRPEKFEEFREDYRFTGKEDDVEVGLIYFGKRYYAPLLQRWISADPLTVHAPGAADMNLYAYVHGKVLVAVDPVGLCGDDGAQGCGQGPPAGEDNWTSPDGTVGVEAPQSRLVERTRSAPAPEAAHATPHRTGALTQQGPPTHGDTTGELALTRFTMGIGFGDAYGEAMGEEPGGAGTAGQILGGLSPAADVRDVGYAGSQLYRGDYVGGGIGVLAGMVGFLPGGGDAAKPVVKQAAPELVERIVQIVRRFDTKANIKQARKKGIEFDPKGRGIPTTTTDIEPVNPDRIREATGANNADAFIDIDVTGKPTMERRTKAGHKEIVVLDSISPSDIVGHGKVRRNKFSSED